MASTVFCTWSDSLKVNDSILILQNESGHWSVKSTIYVHNSWVLLISFQTEISYVWILQVIVMVKNLIQAIICFRVRHLEMSCDNFPTCLVLVYSHEILGHSRLSSLPSLPLGCLIESGSNKDYLSFYLLIEGRVGPSKHNCLSIVFIGFTMTTCFGRAWPSSGHKLDYK